MTRPVGPVRLRTAYVTAAVLLAFGYSVSTVWSLYAGLSSSAVNLVLKAIIAALFVLSLPYTLRRLGCLLGPVLPVLVFLSLYSVRIIYDVVFLDIRIAGAQSHFYVLSYFFGLTLLPVLAIAGAARIGDGATLAGWSFRMLLLANASLIFFAWSSGIESVLQAFSGRLQADGNADGTAVLNPIGIGLMGACLAAMSLARIAFGSGACGHGPLFYYLTLMVGVANILLGASRGPALAFAVCVLAVTLSAVRSVFGYGPIRVRGWALTLVLAPLGASFAVLYSSDNPVFLFERVVMFIEERSSGVSEERDLIRDRAWEDFSNSPVLGSSHVVSLENSLAHNVVIEALISVGAFGALVLLWALAVIARSIWRMWRGCGGPDGYSLGLVGLCLLVIQLTSGTIGQNPEFWVFASLLLVFSERRKAGFRGVVNQQAASELYRHVGSAIAVAKQGVSAR